MKKATGLASVLLGCLALTACSFVGELYLVNTTGNTVQAVFYFGHPITERLKEKGSFPLQYDTGLVDKVNSHTAVRLKQHLAFELVNDSTLSIDIPARSTVFFSKGISRADFGDSVRFTVSDRLITLLRSDPNKELRHAGIFSPKYFSYFIQ